jgi:hypothetical protein
LRIGVTMFRPIVASAWAMAASAMARSCAFSTKIAVV